MCVQYILWLVLNLFDWGGAPHMLNYCVREISKALVKHNLYFGRERYPIFGAGPTG